MAVVRARTSPPYALIIFIILWVISTGLAVFLLVQRGDLKKDAQKREDELPYLVDVDFDKTTKKVDETKLQAKLNEIKAYSTKSGTGDKEVISSAYTTLLAQRSDLIKRISGGAASGVKAGPDAVAEADKALAAFKTTADSLKAKGIDFGKVPNLASLTGVLEAAQTGLDSAYTQIANLNQKYDLEHKAVLNEQEKSKGLLAELQKSVDVSGASTLEYQKKVADAEAALTKLRQDYEKRLTDDSARADAKIRELQLIIQAGNARFVAINKELIDLKEEVGKLRKPFENKIPSEANGMVVRTNNLDGECFINLGRAERVVRGLTFAVFDAAKGVSTEKDVVTKASLEVIEVHEHESLCRITRTALKQRVTDGDVIYNLVFSQNKNRQFHFVVYGDFDLDGDGHATPAEAARVVQMITSWGGKIDEIQYKPLRDNDGVEKKNEKGEIIKRPAISPQTDFLVLGVAPRGGTEAKILDAVSADEAAFIKSKAQEYEFIEGDAKTSSVSILNGSRFLTLIGYYNTTLVH